MAVFKFKLKEDNRALIKNATQEQIVAAMEAIGAQAENYAKMKCPVDTGRLRNSITHTFSGGGSFTASYTDEYAKGSKGKKQLGEGSKTSYSYTGDAGGKLSQVTVYVGTAVEYAPYVEYGTAKHEKARPFIKPSISNHLDEYQKKLETFLRPIGDT